MDDVKTQLAGMLMLPPPRFVPKEVLRAATKKPQGVIFLILGICLFSALFIQSFFPGGLWRDLRMATGKVQTTTGRVVAHEKTKLSANKRPVYRTTFEYRPEGSATNATALSYSSVPNRKTGNSVTVDYLKESPSTARVHGERQSPTGWLSQLLILVPTLLFLTLFFNWRDRRRTAFLLRHGELGHAKVEAVEPTNMSVNNQRVHRITLAPPCPVPASRPLVVRRHDPAVVELLREHQKSGQPVRMLFDPAHPKRVFFPDAL